MLFDRERGWEEEREREREPAMSPSEMLGGSNKNIHRSTLKTIKQFPVALKPLWVHNPFGESDKSSGVF